MLSELIITVLKARPELREKIASELGKSVYSVDRYIKDNKEYGELTTAGMIKFLSDNTGLTQDQIIREKVES